MTSLNQTFKTLVEAFLAEHLQIRHEWKFAKGALLSDHAHLVCAPGSPNEVFATLHAYQIALGPTKGDHEDFEDFGRGLSEEDVAREAFDRFVEVLAEQGHLPKRPNDR